MLTNACMQTHLYGIWHAIHQHLAFAFAFAIAFCIFSNSQMQQTRFFIALIFVYCRDKSIFQDKKKCVTLINTREKIEKIEIIAK